MELKTLVQQLLKWWWLIILSTAVATVSSLIALRGQPPTYLAKSRLIVGHSIQSANPSSIDLQLSIQLAQTYVELAKGREIMKQTAAALGITELPSYTVSQVPNTQLLEIRVLDTSPERAQAVANELAQQLTRLSPTESESRLQSREFLSAQLSGIQKVMDETDARIIELKSQIDSMFSARQIADATNQMGALNSKRDNYMTMYVQVLTLLEGGANVVRVVEAAELPAAPVGQGRGTTVALAAAIGFLLATAAAYLMEYLDDTLKSPNDIRDALRLPTLGTIARIPGQDMAAMPIALQEPGAPETEAYRVLRTNIQFSSLDSPPRTLIATSSYPLEGKSTTLANLAVVLAQLGQSVILVDADLRRPAVHRIFNVPNHVGLSSALLQPQPTVDGFLHETQQPNLQLLTSGPLPPDPSELLGSHRFTAFIAALKERADIVLFDSPPVLGVTDAALLARQVDGVLLIVDAGTTRRQWALASVEALQRVNTKILGVVLNRLKDKQGGYYSYRYRASLGDEGPRSWRAKLNGVAPAGGRKTG